MYADFSDFTSASGQMSSRPWRFGSLAASAFLLPRGSGPLWDGVRCGGGCGGEWKFAAWGRVPQWASGGGRSSFLSRAPVLTSEAESPRPEPPRRLRGLPAARCDLPAPRWARQAGAQAGALLLPPFLGRQEKVSMRDSPNLFMNYSGSVPYGRPLCRKRTIIHGM